MGRLVLPAVKRHPTASCLLCRLPAFCRALPALPACQSAPASCTAVCTAADEKAGIVYCDMDFAQLAERRQNMPLRQQKRGDLYSLLDLTR